jgi:FG-GAP-like repeat/IPT/TIG domain
VSGKKLWGPVLLVVLACMSGLVVATSAQAASLSFAPARHFPAGHGPVALAAGDLNRDGRPDLVTANSKGDSVRVLLGNGRGGFAGGPLSRFATGAGPASLALADFNSDGKLDVVTGNGTDATISVLLGDGDGGFAARADFAVGPAPLLPSPVVVAVGDFNGDGHPDVVACDQPWGESPWWEAGVLLGDGAGGFAPRIGVPAITASCRDIAVGDFNGDGKQDLVTAFNVPFEDQGAGVLLGDGSGHFSAMTLYFTHLEPFAVAVGDLNGDGKEDLVAAQTLEGTGELEVLLGDGAGGFAGAPAGDVIVSNNGGPPSGVVLGDFNGDGRQDVASALGTRALVLRGDGKGGLLKPVAFPVGAHPVRLAAADFNGDGMLDPATADYAENSVSVLLNGPRAAPVLRDLTPCQGRVGAVITLTGARFGASRGASVVGFGATTAVSYAGWSATKIKVRVPPGTPKGWVKVSVRTVAGHSATKSFRRL